MLFETTLKTEVEMTDSRMAFQGMIGGMDSSGDTPELVERKHLPKCRAQAANPVVRGKNNILI